MKPSTFCLSLSQMLELTFGRSDAPSVNLKMLQNFLRILLRANGLNTTIVNYQGVAADEMRALLPSSFESKFDDNIAINVYETTHYSCDKSRQNDEINVYVEEINCNETNDHTKREPMTESKLERTDLSMPNHTENAVSTKSLEVDKMTILTLENLKQSSDIVSRKDFENSKSARQVGGANIADEVIQMHKRMSQIEDQIIVLNEHIINVTSQNNESKKGVTNSNKNKESTLYNQTASADPSDSSLKNESFDRIELDIFGDVDCCKLRKDIRIIMSVLAEVRRDICDLREKIYEITKPRESEENNENYKEKSVKECVVSSDSTAEEKYLIIKQKPNNYKPTKCTDFICNIEASLKNAIQCIDKRMQNFENYVNCSLKNINEIISKNKNEEELIQYVQGVRSDLENVKTNVTQLKYNEMKQNLQFDAISEEICLLKTIKADQQTVQLSLAEKADAHALSKKVSHEELKAVCDDLTRNLNEVIVKLSQQDSVWQQYLVDVRCEIEEKLDDLQISALKDFVNYQLQTLKNQLKSLSQVKHEQESTGARKMLRNLRCLVCNKDVYMNTNSKMTLGVDPFPCRMNIKPYLTFKMNQIRQQQTNIYQDRNLLHLEKITNRNGDKSGPAREENDANKLRNYLCDRYCGGSHTIITTQHKTKKSKTDIAHWAADDLKLVEGFVRGTDSQIYRGRWIHQEDGGNIDQSPLQENIQACVKV